MGCAHPPAAQYDLNAPISFCKCAPVPGNPLRTFAISQIARTHDATAGFLASVFSTPKRMTIHRLFHGILQIVKWPMALAAVLLLPACLWALYWEVSVSLHLLAWVFAGAAAYLVAWYCVIRTWTVDWLSTFEHEITHCIFAWLTGNRVTGLKVTLRQGGNMTFVGTPNWLIALAPYFFPTVTVILLLVLPHASFLSGTQRQFLIGLSLAYHLTSTWTETHHAQTDLQKAGFLFCWMFLPAANVAVLGMVLAAARNGWPGMQQWVHWVEVSPWLPRQIGA